MTAPVKTKRIVGDCREVAGSRPGDLVLDPFAGTGTTGMVATQHGRRFVGIELNPEYSALAREDTPMKKVA